MKRKAIVTAAIGLFCHAATGALVTFETVILPPAGFENNFEGGLQVGDATFINNYDADLESWSGFAVSSLTDNSQGSLTREFSAITGGGVGGSANYAIGLFSTGITTEVSFESATSLLGRGTYITNTTRAYYEILEGGELNLKKFGGPTGNDPDWFKLVIEGFVGTNSVGEVVEFYLADFTFAEKSQDYIVNDWQFVDLSPLGEVDRVAFSVVSSNTGINVPAYFAMDNFMVVPEPSSSLLILVGSLGWLLRRKR